MANKAITVPLPYVGEFGIDTVSQSLNDPRFASGLTNFFFLPKRAVMEKRQGIGIYHDFSQVNSPIYGMSAVTDGQGEEYVFSQVGSGGTGKIYYHTMSDNSFAASTSTPAMLGVPSKFFAFNGNAIFFQKGAAPAIADLTTTISFASISMTGSYTPTTSSPGAVDMISALGRLWALEGTDLKFTDLLDETAWNGVYDLSTIWSGGGDNPVALAEYLNYLIVFGETQTIIFNTSLGGDNLIKETVIRGTGCISAHSIVPVNGDLWFMSLNGMQSLKALLSGEREKSLLSKRAFDTLDSSFVGTLPRVQAAFHPQYNAVFLVYKNKIFIFDLNKPLGDGTYRIMYWDYTPEVYRICIPTSPLYQYGNNQPIFFGGGKDCVLAYDQGTVDEDWSDASDLPIHFYLASADLNLGQIDPKLPGITKIIKQWGFNYDLTSGDATNNTATMDCGLGYGGGVGYTTATTLTFLNGSETAHKKATQGFKNDVFSIRLYQLSGTILTADQFTLHDFWVTFVPGKRKGYN